MGISASEIRTGITASITISALLSTAMSYLADKEYFLPKFSDTVAQFYGLSIPFLILVFVFLLIRSPLSDKKELFLYLQLIVINLVLYAFLLFASIEPLTFGVLNYTIILVSVIYNLSIPLILLVLLLYHIFLK